MNLITELVNVFIFSSTFKNCFSFENTFFDSGLLPNVNGNFKMQECFIDYDPLFIFEYFNFNYS